MQWSFVFPSTAHDVSLGVSQGSPALARLSSQVSLRVVALTAHALGPRHEFAAKIRLPWQATSVFLSGEHAVAPSFSHASPGSAMLASHSPLVPFIAQPFAPRQR